ncbi:MAG: hypothetical protein ABIW03_04385 [Sphingomicrobium sp.]
MLLAGPRHGENDFLEFPTVDEAIAFGRELYGEPRFQLDGIEDGRGKTLMACDQLNDLCRLPVATPNRQYG